MNEVVIPSLEQNQIQIAPGYNTGGTVTTSKPIELGDENLPIPSAEVVSVLEYQQAQEAAQVARTQEIGSLRGERCDGAFTVDCLSSFGLVGLIPLIMAYAFILAGTLSVLFVFWGGITFILSGGDDEKVKKSVNTIRYAILGFIVAVFSYFLVGMVGNFLGINISDFVSYSQVIDAIKSLAPSSSVSQTQ